MFIIIKESLDSVEIDIQCNDVESVWCKLTTPDRGTMALGCFYRPPGATNETIKSLDSVLASLPDDRIILAGDFNLPSLKWDGAIPPSGNSSAFYDVINTYGLEQYVLSPTRGTNILDLILCNDPSVVRCVSVLPGISDHNIVSAKFILPQLVPASCDVKKVYMYNRANYNEIISKLESELDMYTAESLSEDVDALWIRFKNLLLSLIDNHIPFKHMIDKSKPDKPWMNRKTKKVVKQRSRMYKKI